MVIQPNLFSIISIMSLSFFPSGILVGMKGFPLWVYANAELLPLIPAIIIVGGLIILTLSYVSWRKYKGEAEKLKRKKDKTVD